MEAGITVIDIEGAHYMLRLLVQLFNVKNGQMFKRLEILVSKYVEFFRHPT